MQFVLKSFSDLSAEELYKIYFLRSQVFVVEQNCAYQDPDHKDIEAMHVMVFQNTELAAYARILPPGVSYAEPSIGRVLTGKNFRGKGIGLLLMNFCIKNARDLYPGDDIVISAQAYLRKFYSSLGFNEEGEPYDEDFIPHQQMRLKI